jgi:hypothetical protein
MGKKPQKEAESRKKTQSACEAKLKLDHFKRRMKK